MKRLAQLIDQLERHTGPLERQAALTAYLREATPGELGWLVALATERGPKALASAQQLRLWACEASGHEDWMVAACFEVVEDLCETLALMLDQGRASQSNAPLDRWIEERLLPAQALDPDALKASVIRWGSRLDAQEIYILNHLLLGNLRVHAPTRPLVMALASVTGLDAAWIAHRLAHDPPPGAALLEWLRQAPGPAAPRPYALAAHAEGAQAPAAHVAHTMPEGQRAELVRRAGAVEVWGADGQRLTARLPELVALGATLPDDTALDGLIVADGGPAALARRLDTQRPDKPPSRQLLREAPLSFVALDLLELQGTPQLDQPLSARLSALASLQKIERAAEGEGRVTLWRRLDAPYDAGVIVKPPRQRCVAALMYVRGRGAGAEHSFGVWDGPTLVRIAAVTGGMTAHQANVIEVWTRANTRQRFGPVREVEPHHVYELSFDGALPSKRHRAGFELRDARIERKRDDVGVARIDTLDALRALIGA